MEQPHHQATFGISAGDYQQVELNALAQHLQCHLASEIGTAQLNLTGGHSGPVTASNLQSCPPELPPAVPPKSKKWKRLRDWEEAETSALLERVNLPEFRNQKRKQDYMKWDTIAAEIRHELGSDPAVISGKRCNERMKTLKGCYEKVTTEKREVGGTEEEWRKSKGIALDWWYDAIGAYCGPRKGKVKPRKGKVKSRKGKVKDRTPAVKTFATKFNSLTKWQRSTLLDLHHLETASWKLYDDVQQVWRTCDRLSMVQSRTCLDIYEDVIALHKMGLFREKFDDEGGEGSGDDEDGDESLTSSSDFDFSGLFAHETFLQKAVAEDKNPAYDTRRTFRDNAKLTFDATCAPSRITMLSLHDCKELEVIDMSGFGQLRFLSIGRNPKLREVLGWECLEELRCLEAWDWSLYHGYPPLQKMPSLQEFVFFERKGFFKDWKVELDVSGCVCLRRLEICNDFALSSIRGLEGLLSLTCVLLNFCEALQILPDIGHMKDLGYLSISGSLMEEIKGVERLSSLKYLNCTFSKLKTLPALDHLPYLEDVDLYECPMLNDPSSLYYKNRFGRLNCASKYVDVSDTE